MLAGLYIGLANDVRLGLRLGPAVGSSAVGEAGPVNTAPPQIHVVGEATPLAGEVVELFEAGIWTGSPVLTYQWLKNGVAIGGQTNPAGYTLLESDVGAEISLLEIPNGQTEDGVPSAGIEVVPDPPVNVTPPVISSPDTNPGATLSYDGGDTWSPEEDSKMWLWKKDGTTVGEAGTSIHGAVEGAGDYSLEMTATNAGGTSEPVSSNIITIA